MGVAVCRAFAGTGAGVRDEPLPWAASAKTTLAAVNAKVRFRGFKIV